MSWLNKDCVMVLMNDAYIKLASYWKNVPDLFTHCYISSKN